MPSTENRVAEKYMDALLRAVAEMNCFISENVLSLAMETLDIESFKKVFEIDDAILHEIIEQRVNDLLNSCKGSIREARK